MSSFRQIQLHHDTTRFTSLIITVLIVRYRAHIISMQYINNLYDGD